VIISTYTEPQLAVTPVTITPVNESPHESYQVNEAHDSENEDFAQILAGFLQQTEEPKEESENTLDAQITVVPNVELDITALTGETVNLEDIGIEEALINIFGMDKEPVSLTGEGLSETEIPQEQLNILLSAQNLLDSGQEITDESGKQVLTSDEKVKTFTEFASRPDAAAFETEENVSLAAQASAETAVTAETEEAILTDAANKKDLAFDKKINVEKPVTENAVTSAAASNREAAAALRKDGENDNRLRADEPRNRSRRDRLSFEVRDHRTQASAEAQRNTEMRINAGVEISPSRLQSAPIREMTLELKLPDYNSNTMGQSAAQTNWNSVAAAEVRAGNALENMLARELHQNFNGDIVRHASVALRDGGEGTIRIALKPESLGNVKIHLEMSENKITGQIIVESEEALNAFKKEIASLEQAFKEQGFTSADLNLSLTSDGRNEDLREQQSAPAARIASQYDDAAEKVFTRVDVFYGQRPGALNVFA
jgi:flagellar hook-length control protein FliK